MEAILAIITGLGGLVIAALVAAFAIGWWLLRRSARKLKETT